MAGLQTNETAQGWAASPARTGRSLQASTSGGEADVGRSHAQTTTGELVEFRLSSCLAVFRKHTGRT